MLNRQGQDLVRQFHLGIGALVAAAPGELEQAVAQRIVGGFLHAGIQRRYNLVTGRIAFLTVALEHLAAHHFGNVGGIQFDCGAVESRLHREGHCLVILGVADVAQVTHAAEYVATTNPGAFRIGHRVVARGRR